MSDTISYVFEVAIKPGRLEDFREGMRIRGFGVIFRSFCVVPSFNERVLIIYPNQSVSHVPVVVCIVLDQFCFIVFYQPDDRIRQPALTFRQVRSDVAIS